MSEVAPVEHQVLVPASPAVAFDVFTSGIGAWWPLATNGVYGDGSVAFVDGVVVETAANGDRAVWGTVTAWEPPHRVSFTWHPGRTSDVAGGINMVFTDRDGQTLVSLRHDGWESYAEPSAARDEYDLGWPIVLDRYREHVAASQSAFPAG